MSEEQLAKEWREEVRENFRILHRANEQIAARVRSLEDTKTKAIGAVSVIQLLGLAAIWFLDKLTSSR